MQVNVKAEVLKVGQKVSFKGRDGENVEFSPIHFLPSNGEPFTVNLTDGEKVAELKKLERQTKEFVFTLTRNNFGAYKLSL